MNAGDWGFIRAYKKAQAWMITHPTSLSDSEGSEDEEFTSCDELLSSAVAEEVGKPGGGKAESG